MDAPVMMTKEYWLASQLSVARFTGGKTINSIHL